MSASDPRRECVGDVIIIWSNSRRFVSLLPAYNFRWSSCSD